MRSEPYGAHGVPTMQSSPSTEAKAVLASPAAPGKVEAGPIAVSDARADRTDLLLRIWSARALFVVPIAVLIGWLGEMALLTQNDFVTSTRNYVIAILLTILALVHPTWTFLHRRSANAPSSNVTNLDGRQADHAEASSPVVANSMPLAIDVPEAGAGLPARSPGPASPLPGVGGESPVASSLEAQVPTLPTRRARARQSQAPVSAVGAISNMGSNGNGAASTSIPFTPYEPSVPIAPRRVAGRNSTALPAVAAASVEVVPAAKSGIWERYKTFRAKIGWKATAGGLAVVVVLAVVAATQLTQNSGSVLGGWLWVASLLVLLATFLGAEGWPRGEGLMSGPWDDWFGPGVPKIAFQLEVALVVVMMGVALAMRVWNLEYLPGIFGDEGERGVDARAIFNGQPDNIFGTGWWGVPNLYFYTIAASFRIFGDNLIGDRMVSVVSGLVAVFFIYKTARLLWGPRAGLIAGAMLAVSPLALQFSRLAGESSVTGALWAVGAYFLFMALRHRRWLDFVLAGFFWSINLYYYPSGKLIIPLAGLVVLYALVRWHIGFFKKYALGFVLMGFAFLLTFMPYAFYSIQDHWQAFIGRAQETSIFSPQNQQPTFGRYGLPYDPSLATQPLVQSLETHPAAWAGLIYQQAREGLDALYRRGDQVFYYREDRNDGIVLQPLWAVIALLGLAYAAWKILDARFGLALIWFIVGLSGTFLTLDVPNLQRYTGAWPAVMLFPAALIDRVLASGWKLNLSIAKKWSAIPVAALCIYLGADSYQEYFVYYPTTCPYCTETVQARYVQALGQDYKGYQMGVGGYDVYFGYGSTRFVAKGVEGEDMLAAADDLPVTDNNGKGLAFIIYPNNAEYLPLIQLYYPMGTLEVESGQNGQPIFTSIKVTREQLASTRMLHATYKPASGNTIQRDEAGIGTSEDRSLPDGLAYPVQAQWQGGLVAPQYGTYTFSLDGAAGDGKLELDGRAILQQTGGAAQGGQPSTVKMVLAKGVHDVRLTGTLASSSTKLALMWSAGSTGLSPIDPTFLFDGPTGGLSGEIGTAAPNAIRKQDPFGGQQPTQRRSDPFVGFREASVTFGNSSYLARWQGKLAVPSDGDYGFSMGGNVQGVIMIDGKSVYGTGPDGTPGNPSLHLTAGLHDIEVRYASAGGSARIELLWITPGGQSQIIPPTSLVPAQRSWTADEVPNAPAASLPPTLSSSQVKQPNLVFGGSDLAQPRGIAVDKNGNVFVGDRGNHRIVVYTPDGKVAHTWGQAAPQTKQGEATPPPQPGQFGEINDVAVSDDGTVYVFDTNMRVQAFTEQGDFKGSFEPGQLNMFGPNGIATGGKATDKNGVGVYIAVTGQNRIVHTPSIDAVKSGQAPMPQSLESISIDGKTGDHLEQPVDVVADPSGNKVIYTIDLKDRIVQLTPPAKAGDPWTISKQWSAPVGRADGGSRLAISPDAGTIYMTDPDRNRVDILDLAKGRISYIGTAGAAPGDFGSPSGIAVGSNGTVYVVDSQNNNVQVFNTDSLK